MNSDIPSSFPLPHKAWRALLLVRPWKSSPLYTSIRRKKLIPRPRPSPEPLRSLNSSPIYRFSTSSIALLAHGEAAPGAELHSTCNHVTSGCLENSSSSCSRRIYALISEPMRNRKGLLLMRKCRGLSYNDNKI